MKKQVNEIKIKELIANETIQRVIKNEVFIPEIIIIKQVKNPFTNKDTNETTQKIHAVAGTSLADMVELDFTLSGQTIDPVEAINKNYKMLEYSCSLVANMHGGNFNGYSATGLKLIVTKMEEVKGSDK